MELEPLKKAVTKNSALKKKLDFLVTGVGMTATAYHLVKNIYKNKYDIAVNIGLAGSFRKEIPIGKVVNVVSDRFADLGAKSRNNFLTLAEIGLHKKNQFPFRDEKLLNAWAKRHPSLKHINRVSSITVNTLHDNSRNLKTAARKFNPGIESMEGAAFFYVCMLEKIPCVQLRAVSNAAGIRDKKKWNIPLALKNLTEVTFDFLKGT